MFNVNDYVMYNASGVYKVVDIVKGKDIDNNDTEYYVLEPAFKKGLTIKLPVNNKKIMMRGIITKDDAISLIDSIPEKETVWIDDYKQRNESFKTALKTGKCEELAKVIKTIYLERKERIIIGKNIMKSDEDIMKIAEKNLYEEFGIALDMSPNEVLDFILERIS